MSSSPKAPLPRTVWRLTAAVGLASTADWYLLFAVFWIAAARDWSGDQIAVLVLAARAPTLLGGVLGGRAVDALGPRVVLLVDGFVRGGASAGIVLAQVAHRDGYPVILAFAACSATSSPLSYAASRALMPRLVGEHQLSRANSLLSVGDQAPIVLAAAVAGPALLWLRSTAFTVPLVLMAAVCVAAWPLRNGDAPGPSAAARHGGGPVPSPWRSTSVVAMVALSTVYFFVYGPFQPLLPLLVKEDLGGGAGTYSIMRIMLGIGSLLGLLLAPRLCALGRPGVVNAAGAALYGLVLIPMMLVHSTTAVVLIYTVSGVVWGPYAAVEATALQHWTDSRQHGRVFGTQRALIVTAIPLGGAAGSLALGHASVALILVVSAAACTLTGLVALLVPAIRTPVRPSAVDDEDGLGLAEPGSVAMGNG